MKPVPRISRKALSAAILTPMLLSTSIHESPDTAKAAIGIP